MMKGHFRLIIDRVFVELWQPLTEHWECPDNIFGEIYAGLKPFLRKPTEEFVMEADGTIRAGYISLDSHLERAMSDPAFAEQLVSSLSAHDFESESCICGALTKLYVVLGDVAGSNLASRYLELLKQFIDRYSLRYYVDDEARLWISFSGLASALFWQLRLSAEGDDHIVQQLNSFEQALADCLAEPGETRIKTVIQKQVNVLEAFGAAHSGTSKMSLGTMFKSIGDWPHDSLADSARELYTFTNSYPGIRHGGTADEAKRSLDMRDLASVTLSLVGLVAYVADGLEVQTEPSMEGELALLGTGTSAEAPWQ